MGLTVCYDLRFPELYRKLAEQGAQLIFVPSAFTAYTGEAHWETLLRARAIENQAYIIAPDQFGKTANSFETHGHSMIIDPWGRIIAELPHGPGVITATIDLDYLAKIRAELPALSHRQAYLRRAAALPHRSFSAINFAKSPTRQLYPHSLSYHESTLAIFPSSTTVDSASTIEDAGLPRKSLDTRGSSQ